MFADELQQRSDLGANTVIVYSFMFDKYQYWMKERGKYTPTMEYLAVRLGMSQPTIKNCVKKLEKAGLLKILKKGAKGQTANSYQMFDYREHPELLTKPTVQEYFHGSDLVNELDLDLLQRLA